MGIPVCRNVKLVNVFYRLEFIEAYGTGILKIMEVYAGTRKEPKIERGYKLLCSPCPDECPTQP